ncbi:hypothetical protein PtrSN002B_002466 [Pyrenophora tritici-repentis]|uniref:Probable double zinc ribbon domain-containing protein n=1 Tax=Pyrenophora tritici-repentis TaxID=45151 RepID=A0A5M9LTA8_9PLEO|nr:hypothetical protein PtrV1_02948 [Pyrenophora tritici-repentis]KAF7442705.1 hypothetical protein A1F99_135740 [Pyrenophora tritici-repentis]KAF7578915.1 hypothetical protein PtrM4_031550 [Pyrenophora tritici-repentis]KAI1512790.1 hypothetical protein Ptr86124_007810 [Pyrenophora tritici-repentis]KAI1544419.1 hypothetical protein PtrSN001A_002740 [Pyrenophora tritici-repentis]
MTQTISKRVSLSNLTKATSAFVHHSRPKTPEPIRPTLQEQLDAAQPAEEPWDAFSYPKVRTDPGHGIWICGCGFENHLIHYQGSYPFKYLVCQGCEHIMSPYDTTSEVLTSIPCIAKGDS